MGKFDKTFDTKEDLTDRDHFFDENDVVDRVCPVCGSEDIDCMWDEGDGFDTLMKGYECCDCGSRFSYTWWISAVVVESDGRFNKED